VIDLPTPLDLQPGDYVLGGLDSATTPDVIKYALMDGHESDPSLTGSRLTISAPFEAPGETPGFHRPNLFILVHGLELGPMLFTNVPEPSTLVMLGLGVIILLLAIRPRPAKSAG
jgi:PEP-CTERM motif-containing protein